MPGTGALVGSCGPGDEADLVDGDVARAAGDVAAQGVEQGVEHRRPHQRRLVGQRVDQPHGVPALVVGRQPEPVEQ